MSSNPHFETAKSWRAAQSMLVFAPVEPRYTSGHRLQSIRINVRDYKMREIAVADRTLEAHYGGFVLSEAWKGADDARRLALVVSYGREGRDVQVVGCAGRAYELGPEPEADDIDGRSPAVVTWHDAEMHYLIASDRMACEEMLRIAVSLYR